MISNIERMARELAVDMVYLLPRAPSGPDATVNAYTEDQIRAMIGAIVVGDVRDALDMLGTPEHHGLMGHRLSGVLADMYDGRTVRAFTAALAALDHEEKNP